MDEMITEAAIKTCLIYRMPVGIQEKKTKNLDVDRWLLRMFTSKLHSTCLSACV